MVFFKLLMVYYSMNSLASTSSRCSSPRGVTLRMSVPLVNSAQISSLLEDSNKWRLMPEGTKRESNPQASMIYGAIHLVRLFGEFLLFTSNK